MAGQKGLLDREHRRRADTDRQELSRAGLVKARAILAYLSRIR